MTTPAPRSRSWRHLGLGLGLLTACLALLALDPLPKQAIQAQLVDALQRARPRPAPADPRVAIVDINDQSLAAHGQWPWPRTVLAQLTSRLNDAGAAAIAYDITFPEADRSSPEEVAANLPDLPEEARSALRQAKPNDEVFGEALAAAPVILGMGGLPLGARGGGGPPEATAPIITLGSSPIPFLPQIGSVTRNRPVLEAAAQGLGLFTIIPEADNVIRRVPTLQAVGSKPIPSLALEALRVASGGRNYVVRSDPAGIMEVLLQAPPSPRGGATAFPIPVDRLGRIWVSFGEAADIPVISAHDVLNGKITAEMIGGRIIFVGSSAAAIGDIRATPIGTLPGVHVHAHLTEGLLSEELLLRPSEAFALELLLALVLALPAAVFGHRMLPLASFGILVAGMSTAAAATWFPFTEARLVLDGTGAAFTLIVVHLGTGLAALGRTEAEKRRVRLAFKQYLAPAYVDQLEGDPSRLRLGGETRELTILFCDVRGFTNLSEALKDEPERLVSTINDLLSELSEAILENKGTIDKFMGDCVMAFWNAPLPVPDHADAACRAALAMRRRLAALNDRLAKEAAAEGRNFKPLGVGIGINTGSVVVGNVGSRQRFDYSVLGDAVNLAARLEGQSKDYGVVTVLGEATVDALTTHMHTVELDLLRVKGKDEPVRIYTLLGPDKDAMPEEERSKAEYLRAHFAEMLAAYRAQDWDGAEEIARKLQVLSLSERLDDPYGPMLKRIAEHRHNPPPLGWDGVRTADSK